jgi:hypothetical protein
MKKYYKFTVHSKYRGEGLQFIEFDGQWASRQVECYAGKYLSVCDQTPLELACIKLCDQPLSLLELQPEDISSENEFNTAWNQSAELATA